MLEFDILNVDGTLLWFSSRESDSDTVIELVEEEGKWIIRYIRCDATPDEMRQIAAKLLELNGGNTLLQFIEQDDGVINIKHESGSAIGDRVKRDGVYRLTFLYTYDNVDGLYQIADKLKQLNKK